jgi:hypothetical protein
MLCFCVTTEILSTNCYFVAGVRDMWEVPTSSPPPRRRKVWGMKCTGERTRRPEGVVWVSEGVGDEGCAVCSLVRGEEGGVLAEVSRN